MKRLPAWLWMDARTVARQGYDAVMRGEPRYINGPVNRAIASLVTVAPSWVIRRVERRIGHRKM
jgi:short-subunit dehydrogenase